MAGDSVHRSGLGYFWRLSDTTPQTLDDADVERGHLRLEDGWATIELLDENPVMSFMRDDDGNAFVEGWIASMRGDTLLIPEAHQSGFHRSLMGARASVALFRSRTVVGAVAIARLRSAKLLRAEVHFLGLDRFSGLSAVTETHTTDDHGLGKSYSVEVRRTEPTETPLSNGRVLRLGTTWLTRGPADERAILSPVTVSCIAPRPRPASDLVSPLLHVQDLISFVHGGVITAVDGRAEVDLEPHPRDERETRPTLWQGQLMTTSPGVPQAPRNAQRLVVRLPTLGGVSALGRWSRLYENHPRAVRPVVGRYRVGLPTAELQLMEVAAGIEYWVNVHKGRAWAASRKGEGHVHALARRAGKAFDAFVLDGQRWADMFRDANNGLKHDPNYRESEQILAALGASGRYLLAGALLDRVAGSKRPSTEIFRAPILRNLIEPLRQRLTRS